MWLLEIVKKVDIVWYSEKKCIDMMIKLFTGKLLTQFKTVLFDSFDFW